MIVKGQGEAKAAMNGALDLNYNSHSIAFYPRRLNHKTIEPDSHKTREP